MSNRWPAGIIRKTPVTPAGPYQNSAASGVWSLADASYWKKQGLWPTAGNIGYWVNVITGTNAANFTGLKLDSAGNIAIAGKQENGTYDDVYVAKLGPDGTVLWSKFLELGTQYGQSVSTVRKPAIDSSDNIYTTFNVAQTGSSYVNDWAVTKMATDGSLTADVIMQGSSGYDRGDYIVWNGSQLVTSGDYNNTNYVCLVRMNTSLGALTGSQYVGGVNRPASITWDGSNYYITAYKNGFYGFPTYVVKVNSSFAFQWCSGVGADVDGAASSPTFNKAVPIGTDVYACGLSTTSKINNSSYSGFLWKANSSGTQQWQRVVADAAGLTLSSLNSMAKTSDNKLIVVGRVQTTAAPGVDRVYVAKINPAGPSIDWQLLINLGYSGFGSDVELDASDNIYVSGTNFVCKLPSNGSITGTFGSITITSVAYGIATPVTPEATDTQSLTTSTPSISDQGGSFSISTQSYTSALQGL